MKQFSFPAYDPAEKDDLGRTAASARAWTIAFSAIMQAPTGNGARTLSVLAVSKAIKDASVREGESGRVLRTEGALVTLDDADLKVLVESVEKFRENLTGIWADALVLLDQLIASAKTPLSLEN